VRFQLGQHGGVLVGVGQHAHVFPVLGGAAHHGGAADVDVLDGVGQRAAGLGHGGFKRVEVDHQQVDGVDAVLLQGRHVLGQFAAGQQAAVHLGVQVLTRPSSISGNWVTRPPRSRAGPSWPAAWRAAGGQQLDAQRVQGLAKSTMPVLSETEKKCVHGHGGGKV
jgi:hypothetical protein